MTKFLKMACLVSSLSLFVVGYSNAVTIDLVNIGNPGNADDNTGYGGVAYEYSIGKYEITNAQYMEFLNAVASSDPNGLYNTSMSGTYGGIIRNGSLGSYTYSFKGGDSNWANKPVVYVGWYDALRFANWMHNNQPTGAQGVGTTEYGAYDMSLQSTNPSLIVKLSGAKYWLPTEDEWYKSAYYDPAKDGVGGYWDYATGFDNTPVFEGPPGGNNSANYYYNANAVGAPYYTTDVGAYKDSDSPYGTYDQNGNVSEWNETLIGSNRGYRGGMWNGSNSFLPSNFTSSISTSPTLESNSRGFRLASSPLNSGGAIPEPASVALLVSGLAGLFLKTRRRV